MGIPAVKTKKRTAGKLTQQLRKCAITAGAGMGIFLLCAFAPASGAEAKTPFPQQIKTVTVTQKVPFETTYIDLQDRYRGYETMVSDGTAGEKTVRAQVVYEGETVVKVISIEAEDTGKPVNRVMKRGVKELRSQTADGSRWRTSFINPLKSGWLSADFYDYRGHNGVDFAAPRGTPVYAAAEGTVTLAGWYGEYGRCVMLKHADGSVTLYGHNNELSVRQGQQVKQGEMIARVGSTGNSTGNHVHFELRIGDSFLDPLVYIGK